MFQKELTAFQEQVNLELLDDIISFVVHTAEPDWKKRNDLSDRCIFPNQTVDAGVFQKKYGFLYLGELLERYEERFGMSVQDLRAIALALGYTKDITTDTMFVGSQRTDFIQVITKHAEDDLYLTGALYLLHEGQDVGAGYENQLVEWKYAQTEELIFAVSLFRNAETAFGYFKTHLVRLLGKDRTIPVLGNGEIFKRTIAMLIPLKKSMKAKNMAPLRALCALATSYVKEGGKPYDYLRESGYTHLEITYVNAGIVCGQCMPGKSITAEKTVIALFRAVLAHDEALPADVYKYLDGLYSRYSQLDILCYGTHRLEVTLADVRIQVPETMAWFSKRESVYHTAISSFDIMDTKWDSLAGLLDPNDYQRLFEVGLTDDMTPEEVQRRIDRYNTLTQRNYLDVYNNSEQSGSRFSLLVRKGLIDLWSAFQTCLDQDGNIVNSTLLQYIRNYVDEIKSIQAFHFIRQFLPKYGYDGVKRYLDKYRNGFENQLWRRKDYRGNEITLTIMRDFLSGHPEERLLMLHWVEEYFFTQKPELYLFFAQAVLEDVTVAALLPPEDQRGLFELVMRHSKLSEYDANKLKRLYQTPEEQLAEQAAKEAAKAEKKRQEHMELIQQIKADYAKVNDGTFASVDKFLKRYRYGRDEEEIAVHVVRDNLEQHLRDWEYILDQAELSHFLKICGKLVCRGTMGWAEVQSFIMNIKEVESDDSDCSAAA